MKPLWHVTGTYFYLDDHGWRSQKCNVIVAALNREYAFDEALIATCPSELNDANTELLTAVELTGNALADYERQLAERFSQQYSEMLFNVG